MIAYNQYGTPVLGYISISAVQPEGQKFIETEAHHFYYDNDYAPSGWVWQKYNRDNQLMSEVKLDSMTEVLSAFLENTQMPHQIAIVFETIDTPNADKLSSLCTGDVLRMIGPACLETQIELISIDGESFGAPRIVRWGPIPDTPAIFIATFAQDDIDGPITPLFSNCAITDWHDDPNHWHLWEVLYKSGDNYILFQSEIGHDDKVISVYGENGVPRELLDVVVSVNFPTEGDDLHPVDQWGRLLIEDIGRQYLPH